ncbi:MAG TPA: ATP-dependent DNA ligase [Acidobacteriaceae bacterium]|nr:ATP-dependent DNA ligase [Acidobacteriaceae bacterium]
MVSRFRDGGEYEVAAGETSWLRFAMLCETLGGTRSKLTKRAAMAEYLRPLDARSAGFAAQYLTGAVFAESDCRKVQVGGQLVVRVLEKITGATPETFHATYRKYGDLGSAAEELLLVTAPVSQELTINEIAARLEALAAARTQVAKSTQFANFLRALSPMEAKYLIKLLLGDMRTGVKQSLVEEAIAAAAQEELAAVRRAEMMMGNLPAVVGLAWDHALETARFQMFHPLGFMLATPVASAEEGSKRFAAAPAHIEDKYDGMRAQMHCGDPAEPGRVRIFSRTREDVTESFPELAEWFAAVDVAAILDGEILAWDYEQNRALPFTSLQQRLGRKRVTAAMQVETPIIYMAFDLLLVGGELQLEAPLRERRATLEAWVERAQMTAGKRSSAQERTDAQGALFVTEKAVEDDDPLTRLQLAPVTKMLSAAQIDAAFSAAQSRGNEGLMLKALNSGYEPGRRGSAWLKLKRELATLDVVVTAVEYGHGRRAKVLSDYTFAVREETSFRNVGKAYSGLTDAEIQNLTQWFLEHTLDTRNGQLLVEPKIVLEVAFNNVMQSERHDSGYSLRFPRIVRLRPDKPVEEIDTLEGVGEIFQAQNG